jgi:hypothetical protein
MIDEGDCGAIGGMKIGNELSGSIKCWDVLEELHNWQLLKKGSAAWS